MAYEIKYTALGSAKTVTPARHCLNYLGVFLLIALLIVGIFWSSGADWGVTVNALEEMAGQLKQGSGIENAVTVFCQEVLRGSVAG